MIRETKETFDQIIPDDVENTTIQFDKVKVFHVSKRLLLLTKCERDGFDKLCRWILSSQLRPGTSGNNRFSSLLDDEDVRTSWTILVTLMLKKCCYFLTKVRPEIQSDHKSTLLYLNMIVTFTNRAIWIASTRTNQKEVSQLATDTINHLIFKGELYQVLNCVLKKSLNRSRPCISKTELMAAITISLRPLSSNEQIDEKMNLFCTYTLSIPALTYHLEIISPEIFNLMNSKSRLFSVLNYLQNEKNLKNIFQQITAGYGLCLLGNILHWVTKDSNLFTIESSFFFVFTSCIHRILLIIQSYIMTKQSSSCHWHQLLGWFTQKEDSGLQDSLPIVRKQLASLWSPEITKILFQSLRTYNEENGPINLQSNLSKGTSKGETSPTSTSFVLKKALEKAALVLTNSDVYCTPPNPESSRKLLNPKVYPITSVATLYISSLKTLSQARLDILTGLCLHDDIIIDLWQFIRCLDSKNGLSTYVDHLTLTSQCDGPEFQLLILFCECTNHLIT